MASAPRRIATVIGTRPEIIKCSPVLPLLDREYAHVLIHTGQHYDAAMDGQFFHDLDLRAPDNNLAVGSGAHGAQLARMLLGIEPILQELEPDAVFVQGDTNSTLAGALAAAKLSVPVVHLEAGCRSFNRAMPEETNRVIVDHLAALCLAPDAAAMSNLAAEGIGPDRARLVGSTGIDACLRVAERMGRDPSELGTRGEFLVATIHRAENTEPEVLSGLMRALADLARERPVVFPVHPRTERALDRVGRPAGITYLPPAGYPEMMRLLGRCRALLTDSGGLQEEAAVLGTPAFVLRKETEWAEFVEAGRHRLVGVDPVEIVAAVSEALDGGPNEARMRRPTGLERAGAALRVMDALRHWLAADGEEPAWNRPASTRFEASPGDEARIAAELHVKVAHR